MTNIVAKPVGVTPEKLSIREIKGNEISISIPLLLQLYPNLPVDTLTSRLKEIQLLNWACIGVFHKASLVGISGYWINTRLYCGTYLYIDHFVVDEAYREAGVGTVLMHELKNIAMRHQCRHVCLDTFTGNSQAQHFWAKHKFDIVGFHYVLPNKHWEINHDAKLLQRDHFQPHAGNCE